jgi:hypothetical protein
LKFFAGRELLPARWELLAGGNFLPVGTSCRWELLAGGNFLPVGTSCRLKSLIYIYEFNSHPFCFFLADSGGVWGGTPHGFKKLIILIAEKKIFWKLLEILIFFLRYNFAR